MEEDWSLGYSGYSFDSPLFASTLAEEAANDWKTVESKKANRSSRPINKAPGLCGATSKCDCIVCPRSQGRVASSTDAACPGRNYMGRYTCRFYHSDASHE